MKKKSVGKVILKILLGLIIAVIVAAVAAYFVIKYYVVPKYTEKLTESGREEIAELVESNANLSTVPVIGSILSNKQVMEFIKGIDGKSARSILDVLDILDEDIQAEGENKESKTQNVWGVNDYFFVKGEDIRNKNSSEMEKSDDALKDNGEKTDVDKEDVKTKGKSAYERISSEASAEEMADGLAIISKLDLSYIMSLAADGITKEEKAQILKYLRSVLTYDEIERAAELYRKYNKYL